MTPDQIEQVLDMLIERLGPLGEHVWSLYIKQVYIHGIQALGVGVLLLILGIGLALVAKYFAKKQHEKQSAGYYHDDEYMGKVTFLVSAAIAWGIGIAILIFGAFPCFVNPEYQAIQMLLGRGCG